MNYEEMTDQEINRQVASYFYCENWLSRHAEMLGMIPDYCNDPSEAWPIIFENKMTVESRSSLPKLGWMVGISDKIYAVDKNPLRAACICFLKMKDAEK